MLRRWNLRTLRREWRQHVVIFVSMTIGVALSVGAVLAAYNLVEPPESEFGRGQFAVSTDDDPAALTAALDAGGQTYGTVETATATVTGTAQRVTLRAVDPTNRITQPLLGLRDGRWPTTTSEVAVTDRAVIDGAIGNQITIGDRSVSIVGVVENPTRLDDEFVLAPEIEPFGVDGATTQFLVDAAPGSVEFPGISTLNVSTTSGPSARTAVTMAVNVVSAFGLLQMGLLVGAGFTVIARRRRRQFGLLAAAGATPAQLRAAATGVGLIIGAVAAALGIGLGTVGAALFVPRMEVAVGHRIDLALPWWAIALNVVVALAVAALAARWPARPLSHQPVTQLLVAERPRPTPVGRPAAAGVVITVLGAAALAAGFAQVNVLYAVVGVLLAPIGLLLVVPLLVRLLAGAAARGPLAQRLAGRLVGRHNRRSAAVVASLALALSIPVGVVVVTSSLDERRAVDGPNVAEGWFIAWQPGADDGTSRLPVGLDAEDLTAASSRIAESVDDVELIPIEVAVPRDAPGETWEFDDLGTRRSVEPVLAGRPGSTDCFSCDTYGFGDESVWVVESEAWIATPELVAVLGVDQPAGGAVATARDETMRALSAAGVVGDAVTVSETWPNNARVPDVLISEATADGDRFHRVPIGILAVVDQPVDADTRDIVRRVVGPDLVVEFHEPPPTRSGLRAASMTLGLLVGVGIAFAAMSLLVVELDRDREVLDVIGASSRTIRRLSATVTAIVAVAGVGLAVLIGYVALVPLLAAEDAGFSFVLPWRELALLVMVFPVVGAGIGWLGARRSSTPGAAST